MYWGEFAGLERHVGTIQADDFVFWVAAEMERGKDNRRDLKKATVRRGLNTIRAALNHAVQTCSDLRTYKVPRSPLTKKSEEERDRVLSDEEISKISDALAINNELADALFFFQIALITAGRMAEILRMKWEESSERFGTVKLYSSKTQKWRTIKAPAAAALIAKRRQKEKTAPTVFGCPDHWIRGVLQTASESVGVIYGQTGARRLVPSRSATYMLDESCFGWCRRGAWRDRFPSLILLRKIENPTDFINSGFRTESAEQTFGAQLVTIWTPYKLLTGETFSQHRQLDLRLLP